MCGRLGDPYGPQTSSWQCVRRICKHSQDKLSIPPLVLQLDTCLQIVSVLWGDAQAKQLTALEMLYKCTVPKCALGDWELGYRQTVMEEDGLAALIEMCSCVAEKVPVLPIYVLLQALKDPEKDHLHLTRIAHVLIKFAQRFVPTCSGGAQHSAPQTRKSDHIPS
jgi:hypothetical protein